MVNIFMQLKSLRGTLQVSMMQQGVMTSTKDIQFALFSKCGAFSIH